MGRDPVTFNRLRLLGKRAPSTRQSLTASEDFLRSASQPYTFPVVNAAPGSDEARACNSIMHRMPTDLLIIIFEFAFYGICDGKARATFVFGLSHVSSAWRIAALSTSRLWSTVLLDETRKNPFESVSIALERAGSTHLLDIYILEDPFVNITIALTALYEVAHRWKSVTVASPQNPRAVLDRTVGRLDKHLLDNLETICIADARLPRPFLTAKRDGSRKAPRLNINPTRSFLFQNLASLEIGKGSKAAALLPALFTDLGTDSPFLSRLALGTDLLMSPYIFSSFPSVKSLQVPLLCFARSGVFSSISTPALVQLELGPLSPQGWRYFVSQIRKTDLSLHQVKKLRLFDACLQSDIDDDGSYRSTTTGTGRLTSSCHHDGPTSIFSLISGRCIPSEYHELYPCMPKVEPLPELHAAMPALTSLELDDMPSAVLLLWLRAMNGIGEECHWPELQELTLKGTAMRELRAGVLAGLVRERRKGGRPLSRIRLEGSWSYGPPTEVLQYLRGVVALEEAQQ
jgi:hypothetical protein